MIIQKLPGSTWRHLIWCVAVLSLGLGAVKQPTLGQETAAKHPLITGKPGVPTKRRVAADQAVTYDFGVPWEQEYGVTQAYRVDHTIYISGQFSHNMQGAFVGEGDIEAQTRQTLANIDRVLAGYGVTKSNIAYVEVYLINPKQDAKPFAPVFKKWLGGHRVAGTLIGVTGLAFPQQLIEIRAIAHSD